MATQYFQKFPKIAYDVTGTNQNYILMTDIIHRVKFLDVVRNNALILYPYTVKDKETPDIIAHKLYGDPQFYWIVLFSNDVMNLWTEWPLSYEQFIEFLTKKYGSPETSMETVHHYQDKYGGIIDYDSYVETLSDGSTIVYAFEYETNLNDQKKEIRLLDPQYIFLVDAELNDKLKS